MVLCIVYARQNSFLGGSDFFNKFPLNYLEQSAMFPQPISYFESQRVDLKIRQLRVACRHGSRAIMAHIDRNYLLRVNNKAVSNKEPDICILCSSTESITKEHVIPKWAFENDPKRFFKTNVNGTEQTYNKSTVPLCNFCNNNLLANLEKYIIEIFTNTDLKQTHFSREQLQYIIRWLEIIDYKFQILNVRRRFLKSTEAGYIPYLADFPLSMLRMNKEYSDRSVFTEIRSSQKRITIKNKIRNINSLIVFKTSNSSFHFFHEMNDFIFIELPKYEIAIFYFYKKVFEKIDNGYDEAMKLINKFY